MNTETSTTTKKTTHQDKQHTALLQPVQDLRIVDIRQGKNSRHNINTIELTGLMQSIMEMGLLQPIGVVADDNGKYEICYGNRRFLACKKIGWGRISAVVHEDITDEASDMMNLAENVQRVNISLSETGRYISELKKRNMTVAEIAQKLGVAKTYIASCAEAFTTLPVEFRDKVALKTTNDRVRIPGKVSLSVVTAITTARRRYNLTAPQYKELLNWALRDGFTKKNIPSYVQAIKTGETDISKIDVLRHYEIAFALTEKQALTLEKRFVATGEYKSIAQLAKAILQGKESIRLVVL